MHEGATLNSKSAAARSAAGDTVLRPAVALGVAQTHVIGPSAGSVKRI